MHPSDELLMIWTSGSAADPKGVVHTHGAAVRKVAPQVGLGLRPSSPGRVFTTMPLFWVGGPQSLLGALYSGAAILCQERFDSGEALDLIRRERGDSIVGWRFMMERIKSDPQWVSDPLDVEQAVVSTVSSRGDSPNLGMTETLGLHLPGDNFEYKVVDPDTGLNVADGEEGEFRIRGLTLMNRHLQAGTRGDPGPRRVLSNRRQGLHRKRHDLLHGPVQRDHQDLWRQRLAE